MTIGFFGRLRDSIAPQIEVDLPPGIETIADLRAFLAEAHPEAAEDLASARLKAALDDRMADDATRVDGARTVDFFPPVSGG